MTLRDGFEACLPMGLLCGLAGFASGAWIAYDAIGEGYGVFMVAAPIASFISGLLFWWSFVVRRGREGRLPPAIAAGVCAAISANFMTWFLVASVSSPERGLAAPASLVYGSWSLYLLGWIFVPVGAALGALLVVRHRRRLGTHHG